MMENSILEMLRRFPDRKYEEADWRYLFQNSVLAEGKNLAQKNITHSPWGYSSSFIVTDGYKRYAVRISRMPAEIGDSWSMAYMQCDCRARRCRHMAAALFCYEREHGPQIIWENEYDYRKRMDEKETERAIAERREADRKIGTDPIPAMTAFPNMNLKPPVMFDLEKALEEYSTTPAAIARMKEAASVRVAYGGKMALETERNGARSVVFKQIYRDKIVEATVYGTLTPNRLQIGTSIYTIRRYSHFISSDDDSGFTPAEQHPLDQYELSTVAGLLEFINQQPDQYVTDELAEVFFRGIRAQREEKVPRQAPEEAEGKSRKECIEILPRIIVDYGETSLSFRIGITGGRMYVLKNCYQLMQAMENETKLQLGKNEYLDFSTQTIRAGSQPLLDFIKRHQRDSYGGLYQVPLKNSAIDNFYDMGQGSACDYQDKTNQIKSDHVHVGHTDIHFTLTADRLTDARGNFMGIVISGMVPVMIKGNSYRYVLNPQALSRITADEKRVLDPFLKVSDDSGYFRFQVGQNRLQEFYYKILPGLLENPCVEFIDHCEAEATALLPPEPQFTFYLDLEESRLSIRCMVAYGERESELVNKNRPANIMI